MQKQKNGKIINISSNVALTGNPNYIHYVTSKGAIIAMTRAMAREVGDWNICVNTVSPASSSPKVGRSILNTRKSAPNSAA